MRAQIGQGDLGRLLHDVAELAREHKTRLALHDGRLDEQHVAAGAGDSQARRDTRHGGAFGRLGREARPAQVSVEVVRPDLDRWCPRARRRGAVVTLRSTLAIARSSWRTPASWVYSVAIDPQGLLVDGDLSRASPARSIWRGTRWLRAMATFSSSV